MDAGKSLLLLLLLLSCALVACSLWWRSHHRCFACRGWASNRFIYCPWCAQMQFARAKKKAWASRQRPRASAQPEQNGHPAPPVPHRSGRRTVVLSEQAREAAARTIEDQDALRLAAGAADETTMRTRMGPPARCWSCQSPQSRLEAYCGQCGQPVVRPGEPM